MMREPESGSAPDVAATEDIEALHDEIRRQRRHQAEDVSADDVGTGLPDEPVVYGNPTKVGGISKVENVDE